MGRSPTPSGSETRCGDGGEIHGLLDSIGVDGAVLGGIRVGLGRALGLSDGPEGIRAGLGGSRAGAGMS